MSIELKAGDDIHREGSEQQSSKSVCQSSCSNEPLVDGRSFPDLFVLRHKIIRLGQYKLARNEVGPKKGRTK